PARPCVTASLRLDSLKRATNDQRPWSIPDHRRTFQRVEYQAAHPSLLGGAVWYASAAEARWITQTLPARRCRNGQDNQPPAQQRRLYDKGRAQIFGSTPETGKGERGSEGRDPGKRSCDASRGTYCRACRQCESRE